MKKIGIYLLCLFLISAISSVAAFAAPPTTVAAVLNEDKSITISGVCGLGSGYQVSIRVTDPSGKLHYSNVITSSSLDNYGATYFLTNPSPGTYEVTANTLNGTPVKTTFSYGTDNSLSALAVSHGGLDKAFASDTTAYTIQVENRIKSIHVTPTIRNATSTVKVNNVIVVSGSPSSDIPLSEGKNTITVTVTALNNVSKTYTLQVIRSEETQTTITATAFLESDKTVTLSGKLSAGAGQLVTAMVMDPNGKVDFLGHATSTGTGDYVLTYTLSNKVNGRYSVLVGALGNKSSVMTSFDSFEMTGLTVTNATLSPVFKNSVTTYTGTVPETTESVQITATASDSTAAVEISGQKTISGVTVFNVVLSRGINIIPVVLWGKDGVSSKTYTLFITRGNESNVNGTCSAKLENTGHVCVSGNIGTIADLPLSILIKDPTSKIEYMSFGKTTSGGSYNFHYLLANRNIGLYSVQVGAVGIRAPLTTFFEKLPSSTALSSMILTGATINLAFNEGIKSYTTAVSYSTSTVSLTATAIDPFAALTMNGTAIESGKALTGIPLTVGSNKLEVRVITQDGLSETYSVGIMRENPPAPPVRPVVLSSNANLSNLEISSGSLSPAFAAGTTGYTTSVTNGTDSISLTPTVANTNASVKVNNTTVTSGVTSGEIALAVGDNTINIVVTAQNGSAKTYTVIVTRAADANLSDLTVQWIVGENPVGPSLITFNKDTDNYEVTQGQNDQMFNGIYVAAVANDPLASVEIAVDDQPDDNPSNITPMLGSDFTITVQVTGKDTVSIQTYTITVRVYAGP